MASSMTNSDGLITTKKDSINSQLRDIDDQTTSIQAALADKEASLRAQFASLDALLGSMQQTSKFLASKLG
jgi:flagellar hook-associated protein 2